MTGKVKKRLSKAKIIKAIEGTGGSITLIAERCSCDRRTIYRWLERYPELRDYIEEDREKIVEIALKHLIAAAEDGAPWAVNKLLERWGGHLGFGKPGAVDVPTEGLHKVIIEYVDFPEGHPRRVGGAEYEDGSKLQPD